MLKIELSEKQSNLLKRISAPYDPEKDYSDDDDLIELEHFITDYVLEHEVENGEVSKFGEQLLAVHGYIIDKYDS
ncbi:hypothetical protein MmiAt1_03590 [Methanimicrococcus sp. At1]|uniref:Uncharacterized protein n=1 Tax=Methanimicrococcus hacksteinii TaxID=3028293 RepID=A0ABU3VNN1_9EURY|nr:hypothetical protein [Methanimicrococcus sp. At1]MDV0444816.1 hypothetical protein [Methanimicrococcus sp. At1]